MNFLAHAVAQRLVDQLMLLDLALAGEGRADNHRFPVMAVARDFNMLAVEAGEDGLFDAVRSNHFDCLV